MADTKKRPPSTTPEGRENQLIALAYDEAEKQMLAGTAPSQIISHFLKLGSTKDRLEKEILEQQKELMKAKTDAIKASERMEDLYKDAIKAMNSYKGNSDE